MQSYQYLPVDLLQNTRPFECTHHSLERSRVNATGRRFVTMKLVVLVVVVLALGVPTLGDESENIADWITDCGSVSEVKSLEVTGCSSSSGDCNWQSHQPISMSFWYGKVPSMENSNTSVILYYMGQGFEMEVANQTPCVLGPCPLENDIDTGPNDRYNISFDMNLELYLVTVDVVAITAYKPYHGMDQSQLGCIKFSAQVGKPS